MSIYKKDTQLQFSGSSVPASQRNLKTYSGFNSWKCIRQPILVERVVKNALCQTD